MKTQITTRLLGDILIRFRVVFLIGLCTTAQAQYLIPSPPSVAAKAWILMDAQTGTILAKNNETEQLSPASLTKMMVGYITSSEIAQQRLKEDEKLLVSTNAWRKGGSATGGSTMFLREKSRVGVIDLLNGLMIQSGNDAAIVLAENIAGSEEAFVEVMNQQATILGMKNTHFTNSTGWPDEAHLSSAEDMAILSRAVIYDFPEHYKIYSKKRFTYNDIEQPNRNSLLWHDNSVDGIKTGKTEAGGYSLAASAEREGTRYITVVLGSTSKNQRFEGTKRLLSWGFRYYNTRVIYKPTDVLGTEPVWKGVEDSLTIGVPEVLKLTLPRNQKQDLLKVKLSIDKYIEAPINKGQKVGMMHVYLDDKELYAGELVSLKAIPQANFINRIWDNIVYFVVSIFD